LYAFVCVTLDGYVLFSLNPYVYILCLFLLVHTDAAADVLCCILEVIFNVMRSISPRFTYLLTYLYFFRSVIFLHLFCLHCVL